MSNFFTVTWVGRGWLSCSSAASWSASRSPSGDGAE